MLKIKYTRIREDLKIYCFVYILFNFIYIYILFYSEIEILRYIDDISFEPPCHLECEKLTVPSLCKSAGYMVTVIYIFNLCIAIARPRISASFCILVFPFSNVS